MRFPCTHAFMTLPYIHAYAPYSQECCIPFCISDSCLVNASFFRDGDAFCSSNGDDVAFCSSSSDGDTPPRMS